MKTGGSWNGTGIRHMSETSAFILIRYMTIPARAGSEELRKELIITPAQPTV